MPKPRTGNSNTSIASQSSNPFKSLSAMLQGRKREKQELAAREVSEDMVKNGQTIIRILGQIDFDHSELPKEILEKKSSENQPCGDLECTAMIVERELLNAPVFLTDLRELDSRLIKIAYHFKEAVEKGKSEQARYSRIALLNGVKKIRRDVPDTQTAMTKQYIEAMSAYLDDWLILIETSASLDAKTDTVQKLKNTLAAEKEQQEIQEEEFQKKLRDPSTGYVAMVEEMRNMDSPEERKNWTKEMRSLHKEIVDIEVRGYALDFNDTQIEHLESECRQLKGHLQMLESNVAGIPHVTDPNLMDRYQDAINRTMKELFASDARVDEMMRMADEQRAVLDQLAVAPGGTREIDLVVKGANRQMEKAKLAQNRMENERKASARLLAEQGILTNEQMEELRQRQDEELKAYQEELEENQEENQELLYNEF